jgi:hypothetical protein
MSIKAPAYEIRIAAEFYGDKWYPLGSDTPLPKESIVEIYDGGIHGAEDLA